MRRTVFAALLLLDFMALNIACVLPANAQSYKGGISISPDDTVSASTPSKAPIRQEGDTYTLTSDVEGNLWVGRNDTILDGNGHTIIGEIDLHGVSNDTVKNLLLQATLLA